MKVKIVKIHRNKRFGETIYAQLIKADSGELLISSEIEYIMDMIEQYNYKLID